MARLRTNIADPEANRTIGAAEASILLEARLGHLGTVKVLTEAYSDLVMPLRDGDERVLGLRQAVSRELIRYGDELAGSEAQAAGRAWTLAASIADPSETSADAIERLRRLLLPPVDPEAGQVWRSPIDGAELVWQPAARFLMGCTPGDRACRLDERYLRWVEVPGVWLQRTEVTGSQLHSCAAADVCDPEGARLVTDQQPVAGLSWYESRRLCGWLGRRLPSEAEWERAARGRALDRRYPWGDARTPGSANLLGVTGRDTFEGVADAARFAATGWGLYDMAGNLWEWCADSYHEQLTKGPKSAEPWTEGGIGRVMRGGSWRRTSDLARVSVRSWQEAEYEADDVGARCAMDDSAEVSDATALARAVKAFPFGGEPGEELAQARLDAADRRYLDRRALSWLVLEGQPWRALTHAVQILKRDPGDQVARDHLSRIQRQLDTARLDHPDAEVRQAIELFQAIVASDRRLQRELARMRSHLEQALRKAGELRVRQGDVVRAEAHFRLAVTLDPRDPELVRLLRTSGLEPGDRRTWPGDDKQMVWVPPGTFLMGRTRGDDQAANDELPARTVRIRGFWLDRTEVSNTEYRRCVDAGSCSSPARVGDYQEPSKASHPVVWVSWYQARAYCLWSGKRLPSEAEWEWAARAGSSTRYPWGAEWEDGRANIFGTRPPLDIWPDSAPVGSFPSNRLGLVDLLGNAWEWVADYYHSDLREAPVDGRPWTQLSGGSDRPGRVLRGGGFSSFPPRLRVSQREQRDPDDPMRSAGFRCAATSFR